MNIKTIALLAITLSAQAEAVELRMSNGLLILEKASIMEAEYNGNEYSTLKKYNGKNLMVTGKVRSITVNSITGKPAIVLTTGIMKSVMFSADRIDDKTLEYLRAGNNVVIMCNKAKLTSSIFLHIKGCNIVVRLNDKTKPTLLNHFITNNESKEAQIKAALFL